VASTKALAVIVWILAWSATRTAVIRSASITWLSSRTFTPARTQSSSSTRLAVSGSNTTATLGDAPSIRHANFVAITYSSRRPLIAPDQLFVSRRPVHLRRVEEVDTELGRTPDRRDRLTVVRRAVEGRHPPCSQGRGWRPRASRACVSSSPLPEAVRPFSPRSSSNHIPSGDGPATGVAEAMMLSIAARSGLLSERSAAARLS
jgi:hypothetical protein